jgi:hypothetical protein
MNLIALQHAVLHTPAEYAASAADWRRRRRRRRATILRLCAIWCAVWA